MHRALPVLTSSFRATPQQITAPEIMPHGLGRAAVVVIAETEALPGASAGTRAISYQRSDDGVIQPL